MLRSHDGLHGCRQGMAAKRLKKISGLQRQEDKKGTEVRRKIKIALFSK